MIRRLLLLTIPLTLTAAWISCSSVSDMKPDDYLGKARELIVKQQFQLAKSYVDSVRIRFPKAYEKIREGLSVLREINFAEQNRSLAFCDSMLKVRQDQLPEAKSNFIFEKNTEYETLGYYVYRNQQDKNLGKTYLQTKVDEKGNLVLTSYYAGVRTLKHTRIRVESGDGAYAETQVVPEDGALNYTFYDSGTRYEFVCFNKKNENGVIDFILLHENQPVTVTLVGDNSKSYRLSEEDISAMKSASNLSTVLSDITKLLEEMRLAQAKLEYIYKKQHPDPENKPDSSY